MLGHSRCFFLMVELLFFAQSVFVGRFLLLAECSRCLAVLFGLHYCVEAGGFYLVYGNIYIDLTVYYI